MENYFVSIIQSLCVRQNLFISVTAELIVICFTDNIDTGHAVV